MMEGREDTLGYIPQKQLIYNKLLPYGDKLERESCLFLSEIKSNLGNAVLYHDIVPAAVHWTNQLGKFIRLYGRMFSKEDHLQFIKVLFELLLIPDLELSAVQKIAYTLNLLLKKIELLSREDLELPWRPLYELYERILYSSYEHLGMLLLPGNLESGLKTLIRCCRSYFSSSSTQEMLDEWRPLMCPFDLTMTKAMAYFELFLCTSLPPEEHDKGFKLWFYEFMDIWENCHNGQSWENSLVWLFSRLARENIGYVEWKPYIPMVFTRLLRSFNLPGGASKVQVSRPTLNYDTVAVVNWIASMLGGESICQGHINHLFKCLESYYHPSNNGRWMIRLQRLLHKLPLAVVKRLHRERYYHQSWQTRIPEEFKLTDANVTDFVNSLKTVVLLSVFSKSGYSGSAVALQNLSILRPELVIPPVLKGLYLSLETLTEPHRLTAAMYCVMSVAREIVQGPKFFPEGPSHVIPLLMAALPGIDRNDIRKCMVTFQFISAFTTMILIVDCSKAVDVHPGMTEFQQEVYLATAAFEDFVLQFLDRCFVLIENSSLEHPSRMDRDTEKMNPEENIMDLGLSTTFSILRQCSPAIFKAALTKLYTFVSSHILETKVAGKYAANMCRSAARVNAELTLQTLLPHFSKLVLALTESEDVLKEEMLDDELLFCLLLLSEIVRCDGFQLLKHHSQIEKVLERTLHLKCREGYVLAGILLRHTLKAFVLVYPLDFRSISEPWETCDCIEKTMFIENWGKAGDVHNLGMKFHVPSDEEIEIARKLMIKFLVPELDKLKMWVNNKKNLTREDVQQSLNIVLDCIIGASGSLPPWSGHFLFLNNFPSKVSMNYRCIKETGSKEISIFAQNNVRLEVFEVMRNVLDFFLKSCEDDTKSLFLIIKIYHTLMFHWGLAEEDFEARWKGFHVVKKVLENRLVGRKRHLRALLVDRVYLQHDLRLVVRNKSFFTEQHVLMMKDLLKLSISHYSEVRSKAQSVLHTCFKSYHQCYYAILPELLNVLQKDPTLFHDEFKGALFLILGHKQSSLLTIRSWELASQLWPTLVAAKHSEKPSIIKLMEQMSFNIQKFLVTVQIKLSVPQSCLLASKGLWNNQRPLPSCSIISDEQILLAKKELQNKSTENEKQYYGLVNKLVELIETGKLHWRHYHLALAMLCISIRHDVKLPVSSVQLFVRCLVHDTLHVRKVAIDAMCGILKQQKRQHLVMEMNPTSSELNDLPLHPLLEKQVQEKPKNYWLQYNSLACPSSPDLWAKRYFVHKTHVGFYSWSSPFKVYCPDNEQPSLDRKREQLKEGELPIYDCFTEQQFVDSLMSFLSLEGTNDHDMFDDKRLFMFKEQPIFDSFNGQAYVDALLSFFSLEERKGHDKFDARKFYMFKSLFRNFGDTFLPQFLDHLKKMISDKQESSQRCASEIVAGLLRGSKHWSFEKMESLKKQLVPLIRCALNNVTPETLSDWGTCFATASISRDPNKYYWLFELLMEEPIKEESGSFLESSWLYMLLGALAQQEWRVFELLHRIYAYIEPRLGHSYQNVRVKLGSLLSNIFMYDVPLSNGCLSLAPKRTVFLASVIPKFSILETPEAMDLEDSSSAREICEYPVNNIPEKSVERKNAANLLRTVCRWIIVSVTRTLYPAPPEVFRLLPTLCLMQNDTTDDDLQKECTVAIAVLAQALVKPCNISTAINTLKQIACSNSWHSRSAILNFIQSMVFSNLFTIWDNISWRSEINQIVLKLLQDERVEVRETAAETLGGLLHCEFVKIDEELLSIFKQKCGKKLKRLQIAQGKCDGRVIDPVVLRERHAGILGLCACVNAFPYDVPDFLPDVIVLLADHLNDPQPIQDSIKKTLSNFRRTHYDCWRDHKLKFTDDQLAVITDLLVSPSYYA